jgi:hypothetical protein
MPKNRSRPNVLLATGLLWAGFALAQESVNSSGADATGIGGTVAYSVGQLVYTTHSNGTSSAAQGVQQTVVILPLGTKETELSISLTAFPNPTVDNLSLQISEYSNGELSYQLFDLQGKLLSTGQIVGQHTQLNLSGLPSATYFLYVVNLDNTKLQVFKVVKN